MGDRHRLSSRILVFDEQQRLLLFLMRAKFIGQKTRWITPGGGVEPGETHHQAAVRELFEETGIEVDDLGDPVFSLDFVLDYTGGDHDSGHAEYYVLHTTEFVPSAENWTPEEIHDVVEHRWWTRAELEATSDPYEPDELLDLMGRHAILPTTQPKGA